MNWEKVKSENQLQLLDGYQVELESKDNEHTDLIILKLGKPIFKVKKIDYSMQVLIPAPPPKVRVNRVKWSVAGVESYKDFSEFSDAQKCRDLVNAAGDLNAIIEDAEVEQLQKEEVPF